MFFIFAKDSIKNHLHKPKALPLPPTPIRIIIIYFIYSIFLFFFGDSKHWEV